MDDSERGLHENVNQLFGNKICFRVRLFDEIMLEHAVPVCVQAFTHVSLWLSHIHTHTHKDTKRTCGAMEILNKVLIWVVEGLCDNYDPNKVKKVLKYFF